MVCEIKDAKGLIALIDKEDFEKVSKYKWNGHKKPYDKTWYFSASIKISRDKYKRLELHNLIMDCPSGLYVDHIDGNGLDNRKQNLRICTFTENRRNRRKHKPFSSKYKGVLKDNDCWRGCIWNEGRSIYLGCFNSEIDCAKVYDAAARELHGKFASLNFPDEVDTKVTLRKPKNRKVLDNLERFKVEYKI